MEKGPLYINYMEVSIILDNHDFLNIQTNKQNPQTIFILGWFYIRLE